MAVETGPHPYPVPQNEKERLAALYAFDILDTLPEPSFDRIGAMAARLFNAPIALVSLVDDQRQWFKARCGLDALETSRDFSFCAHAILNPEPMVICDATKDERFQTNPLVTGDPHIRFYVGAPLITRSGLALGSLCVIDHVVREAPPQVLVDSLADLAFLVMENLEFRLAVAEREAAEQGRREAERRYRLFAETARDVFVILSEEGIIVTINEAVRAMLGYEPDELLGQSLAGVVPGCVSALREGVIDLNAKHKSGADIPVEISFSKFNHGERLFTAVLRDIRERNLASAALKRTAAAVRANQIKLKEAQQLAHLGHWEWDLTTQAISWSDETYRIFGLPPQSGITFEQYQNLLSANELPKIRALVSNSISTGEPYVVTHSVERGDGSVVHVEGRGRVERNTEGRPVKLHGTVLDVTARVQADLLLRSSHEELESKVQQRTDLLAKTNAALQSEIDLHNNTQRLLAGQFQVLRGIAEGLPTYEVFDGLLRFGERDSAGEFFAALLLKNEDGKSLRWAAAPNMPEDIKAAVPRIQIGPDGGSSAAAAHLGKRVVVTDILNGVSSPLARLFHRHLGARSLASTPILDNENQVLGTVSFAMRAEIPTEHHLQLQDACASLAAVALQRDKSQAKLRQWEQMFKHSAWGMALASASTGKLLTVNPGYAAMLGYLEQDLAGKSVFDVFGQELMSGQLRDLNCFKDNACLSYESVWTRKDGSTIPVRIDIVPIVDAEGNTSYWAENVRDITQQKKSELALDQTLREYCFLADFTPQIFWTARPDGFVYYYNERWFAYTGLTLKTSQGNGWEPVVHPDDAQNCADAWAFAVRTGGPFEAQFRLKRATDGAYRLHLGRALPFRDDDGNILKWFGTCTDIHDHTAQPDKTEFDSFSQSDALRRALDEKQLLVQQHQ